MRVLKKDEIWRIHGPAMLKIIEGKILIHGFIHRKGSKITVPRTRIIALKVIEDSIVEVRGEKLDCLVKARVGEEVIEEWINICNRILNEKYRKILIVGRVDSGKTSFTIFLSNMFLQRGLNVCIIDGDIGQADIGPPSTISMSFLRKPICSLRELRAEEMIFIGTDTPSYALPIIPVAYKMLIDKVKEYGYDVLIINTDGWILGRNARILKTSIVNIVKPDLIIVMGMETPLFKWIPTLIVPSPKIFSKRTFEDRKMLREMRYSFYLKDSRRRVINIDEIVFLNTLLFSGRPLSDEERNEIENILGEKIIYGEISEDYLYIITHRNISSEKMLLLRKKFNTTRFVKSIPKNIIENLLVGLLDKNFFCKAIGIIKDIDFMERKIKILTPYTGEIYAIHIGSIRIDREGKELYKSVTI